MFFLIYVSLAVKLFSPPELLNLLKICQENNAKQEITGLLLYKDGNFMQMLEGEKERVLNLYNKIAGDQRHRGEIILLQGHSDEWQFPQWAMGFRDLSSSD